MNVFLHMLLETTVTMTLLALLLAAASRPLARRYSARSVYLAWQVAMLGFLIPWRPQPASPAVTVQLPAMTEYIRTRTARAATGAGTSAVTGLAATTDLPASQTAQAAAAPWSISVTEILFWAWLLGAVIFLGIQVARHLHFRRLVRRWSRPLLSSRWQSALRMEKARLGITRQVVLLSCPVVSSPMLTGVLHPTILVPDADMDMGQAALVLRHELVHLRRHDLPVKLLTLLAYAVHWFNPAMLLLDSRSAYWCEAACDAEVVEGCGLAERETYTAAILSAIRRSGKAHTRLAADFYGGLKSMKARIASIFDMERKHLGVALVMLAAILTVSTGAAFALSSVSSGETPAVRFTQAQAESYIGQTVYAAPPEGLLLPVTFGPTDPDWPQALCFPGQEMTVEQVRTTTADFTDRGFPDAADASGTWWAYVSIGGEGGVKGWTPMAYLSAAQTEPGFATGTLKEQTACCAGYDLSGGVLAELSGGARVELRAVLRNVCLVRWGETIGFVDKAKVSVDPEGAARVAAQPLQSWDDILPGEDQKLEEYNALIQEKWAVEGDSNTWSLADRAWYSQLTAEYGYDQAAINILPDGSSLTEAETIAFTWAQAELAFGSDYDASHQTDYMPVTSYYYRTSEPDKRLWTVNLWPKRLADQRAAITFTDDRTVVSTFRDEDHYGDQPGYNYDGMVDILGDPSTWSEEDRQATLASGTIASGVSYPVSYDPGAAFVSGRDVAAASAYDIARQAMGEACGLSESEQAEWSANTLFFQRFVLSDDPQYNYAGRGWLVILEKGVPSDEFTHYVTYSVVVSSPEGQVVYQDGAQGLAKSVAHMELQIEGDRDLKAREAEIGPSWRWSLAEQKAFRDVHPSYENYGDAQVLRSTDLSEAELTMRGRAAVRKYLADNGIEDADFEGRIACLVCLAVDSMTTRSGLLLIVAFRDPETGDFRWQVNMDPADGSVVEVFDNSEGNG